MDKKLYCKRCDNNVPVVKVRVPNQYHTKMLTEYHCMHCRHRGSKDSHIMIAPYYHELIGLVETKDRIAVKIPVDVIGRSDGLVNLEIIPPEFH